MKYDTAVTPQSSQHRIASMIRDDGPVFDVGCATGNLAVELRAQGKKNELFGLEIDSAARRIALRKNIYEDICLLDLNQHFKLDRKFIGYFRYIVLADVLEHLNDAESVLKRLTPYLRKDGRFLVSLPNVMNFEVQAAMASAAAEYTETGLLDRTHLHFYDSREIVRLATRASCAIRNLSFTFLNMEIIDRLSDPERMPAQVANYIFENNPYAWEFQYIFELHPSEMPGDLLEAANRKLLQRIREKEEKRNLEPYVISSLLRIYYRKDAEAFSEEKSLHFPVFIHRRSFSLNIPLDRLSDEDIFLRIDFGRPGEIWNWGNISWYDGNEKFISEVDFESLEREHGFAGIAIAGRQLKIIHDPSICLTRAPNMARLNITMSVADPVAFPDIGKKTICYFSGEKDSFDERKKVESFLTCAGSETLSGEFVVPDVSEKISAFRIGLSGLRGVYELCSCRFLVAENIESPVDLKKIDRMNRRGMFSFSKDGEGHFLIAGESVSFIIRSVPDAVKKIKFQLKPVSTPEVLLRVENVVDDQNRTMQAKLEAETKEHKTYESALRKTEEALRQALSERDALGDRNLLLQAKLEAETKEHKTYESALRKTEETLRRKYQDCDDLENKNRELISTLDEKEKCDTDRLRQIRCLEGAQKKLQDDCRSLELELARANQVCADQSARIAELVSRNHAQADMLRDVFGSTSWRVSAPFRNIMKGLRFWRRNGTRETAKKMCRKIEFRSPFFARQMERQRKFRDIRKEQGSRAAFAWAYDKIHARLFPERHVRKIYKDYCDRFSHAVLIIDHNLGGGANVYRNNFIKEKLARGEKCILMHNNMYFFDHRDYSLKFYDGSVDQFKDVRFNDLRTVFAVLDRISPSWVVYNSLVYYPDIAAVLRWVRKCRGKVLLLMHDFFPICQVYNMVDDRNRFCGMERDCDVCLAHHGDIRHLYGRPFSKREWSKLWSPVFAKSSEIRMFSASTRDILKARGVGNEEKYSLIPHSMDYFTPPEVHIVRGNKPKLAVIGTIYNIPKGTLIVEELAKLIAPEPLTVIGTYEGNPVDNIVQTGAFTRDTLAEIINEHSVNMLLIPSVWPETFSYLTSEIIMMKIPLLVFGIGAQMEKVSRYPFGAIIPEMTADSVWKTAAELYRRMAKDFPFYEE